MERLRRYMERLNRSGSARYETMYITGCMINFMKHSPFLGLGVTLSVKKLFALYETR
jgi:hypothetical protein